jgi:hypothetical protein
MRAESKKIAIIITMTTIAFIIGIIPWALLLFRETKNSIHWLGETGFQYWGWLLVLCLAGYAFINTLRSKNISNITRIIVVSVSLIILGWSLLWALLIIFALAISTIV